MEFGPRKPGAGAEDDQNLIALRAAGDGVLECFRADLEKLYAPRMTEDGRTLRAPELAEAQARVVVREFLRVCAEHGLDEAEAKTHVLERLDEEGLHIPETGTRLLGYDYHMRILEAIQKELGRERVLVKRVKVGRKYRPLPKAELRAQIAKLAPDTRAALLAGRSKKDDRRDAEESMARIAQQQTEEAARQQDEAELRRRWAELPQKKAELRKHVAGLDPEARTLFLSRLSEAERREYGPEPQSEAEPAAESAIKAESAKPQQPMGLSVEERKAIRGAFLNPILTEKNWSIGELANNARVDYHTVADYLSGVTEKPRTNTRTKLANALEVSVETLPQ